MKDFQAQLGSKRPVEVFDFNQLDCNQQLSWGGTNIMHQLFFFSPLMHDVKRHKIRGYDIINQKDIKKSTVLFCSLKSDLEAL